MNDSPMNDLLEEFEAELARLKPRAISRDVTERIASRLDEPARMRFADRCLMAFMSAGALAAVVIVGLLSWQILQDHSLNLSPTLAVTSPHAPASIGEYQQALARSDGPMLELFR